MEIEIKIRLLEEQDYNTLCKVLQNSLKDELDQYNHFFDSTDKLLQQSKSTLRLRIIPNKKQAVVTFKNGKTRNLQGGISSVQELETDVDYDTATSLINTKDTKYDFLLQALCTKYSHLQQDLEPLFNNLVHLGYFRSLRRCYIAPEFQSKLEIDHVHYHFGQDLYELEMEGDNKESLIEQKQKLEQLLRDNQIRFEDSKVSKFAFFIRGHL